MKITLTPQQKLQLEQMHDIERDSRVCDRIKAVLLASEGWSQTMISQALRIHESTVARHRAIVKCGVWRSCSSLLMSLHFFHSINEANIFHNIREECKTS